MASEQFRVLKARYAVLKRRYLPPTQPSGRYTQAQQDQMRAMRMLLHAEVEHYLEQLCTLLLEDLERELMTPSAGTQTQRKWAATAVSDAKVAIGSNNGVKEKNIIEMFGDFGLRREDFESISPQFLDRMNDFGKRRGHVAHNSAHKATYALNRTQEEKFFREIFLYLDGFDRLIIQKRLTRYL